MKQQMTLAALSTALFGLVACGGGGGGSSSGASVINNQISPEMAERIKREKALTTAVDAEALDKPVFNNKFIIKGQDFGQKDVELDLFPRYQLVKENWSEEYETKQGKYSEKGFWLVYNQLYSGIVGDTDTEVLQSPYEHVIGMQNAYNNYDIVLAVGVNTLEKQLPTSGLITYKGVAFDMTQQGTLNYHVDFAKKEGSGSITGLDKFGTITLETGKISNISLNSREADNYFEKNQVGITGLAKAEKIADVIWDKVTTRDIVKGYDLQFFGPNAEEITGIVKTDKQAGVDGHFLSNPPERHYEGRIGFAGTKQ